MRVDDVMVRDVLSVGRETTRADVARLLAGAEISGVPVTDGDGIVGVVTATDVLRGGGATAGELMSAPPVCVAGDAPASEAARLMTTRRLRRLPVVHDGRLVGVVSRADLVRAFSRPDATIATEVAAAVPDGTDVVVAGGEVTLRGVAPSREAAARIAAQVWAVPGVVEVHPRLIVGHA